MKRNDYLVEMRGITKRFGRVLALEDVDFTVRYGEVMGLVGDNGAGKSTLLSALYRNVSIASHTDSRQVSVSTYSARASSPNRSPRILICRSDSSPET